MAFPVTSVLSSFTGSDEEPLSEGGAWAATPIRVASATIGRPRRVSNQVGPSTTATVASEAVYATSFTADQEVYLTVAAVTTGTRYYEIYVRIANEGTSAVTAYKLSYSVSAATFSFIRHDSAGTEVALGSTVTGTSIAAGDSFGLSVTGSTLEGWHKPSAGSWTSLGTRTDATYSNAGKLGFYLTSGGTTIRYDEFGGGSLAASQTLLPDADIADGGWATAPLYSKLADSSDATYITATAS